MDRPDTSGVQGLRALVTGGASGIGMATVDQLLAGGARVALVDRVAVDDRPDLVTAIADLTDDTAVRESVRQVTGELGGLDILVNNAGIGAHGGIEDNADEEWMRVFDVNVLGPVRTSRAALPELRRSGAAAIVNVASIAASVGLPQRALYSASKGAIVALTQAMAVDLLPEGVRVNAVSPGTADTPWIGRLLEAASDPSAERRALEARQPHGRLVKAEEVAATIVFLASHAASSITGTNVHVDGGMHSLRPRR